MANPSTSSRFAGGFPFTFPEVLKVKPHLYFHLFMWGTIAFVLFFSSPSNASEYSGAYEPSNDYAAGWYSDYYYLWDRYEAETYIGLDANFWSNNVLIEYWAIYSTNGNKTHKWITCPNSKPYYDGSEFCYENGPELPDPEGTEVSCGGDGSTIPNTVCMSDTRYDVGTAGGLMLESGGQWGGTCVSTGQACTGEESQINPDYDLPVLPKTDQSVEINGTEYPLMESGCGEVAGSLVCTNDPGCGEFNGEWICTGPDNGTEGVPATPTLEYSASGNPTADRAGDQYFYDSTTVSNSTNLGSGGTSDPADDGQADDRTDGSDSGDPNAPLGQGSCPTGYVQTGVTALGDGSIEAQCVPAGDDPDWMGLADNLDMSDQLPSGWLDPPELPGFGGPSSSCPAPAEFSIAGVTIDIPFQPMCDLASMLRPFLILIGYLIAGWFVFRIVGSNS